MRRVVRTTVEKGIMIEPANIENRNADQKTADFLRELPKPTRSRLIEELETKDPESADRLKDLLYMFDDILKYDNRSIQKLLGQIESQVLVVALQDAEEELVSRIFENLSKRATSALEEEMEFKQGAKDEEIEQSRKSIAEVLARLDESGEISME